MQLYDAIIWCDHRYDYMIWLYDVIIWWDIIWLYDGTYKFVNLDMAILFPAQDFELPFNTLPTNIPVRQ